MDNIVQVPGDALVAVLPLKREIALPLEPSLAHRILHSAKTLCPDTWETLDSICNFLKSPAERLFLLTEGQTKFLHYISWTKTPVPDGAVCQFRTTTKAFRFNIWCHMPNRQSTEKPNCVYLLEFLKPTCGAPLQFPSLDIIRCLPHISPSRVVHVTPNQLIKIAVQNFRKGVTLHLTPGTRTIALPSPNVSFSIPSQFKAGSQVELHLQRSVYGVPDDRVIYRVRDPASPPPLIDDIAVFTKKIMEDNESEDYQFGMYLLSKRLSSGSTGPSLEDRKRRRVAVPHQACDSSNQESAIAFSYQADRNYQESDFGFVTRADSVLQEELGTDEEILKRHCATILLQTMTRGTRRGPWQMANIAPPRIGKMRKIHLRFLNLQKPMFVSASSSDLDGLMLSLTGKNAQEGQSEVRRMMRPPADTFAFYVIPRQLTRNVIVKLQIEFIASCVESDVGSIHTPCKRKVNLMSWSVGVAGHKYESSKRGRRLNQEDVCAYLYPIFDPPHPEYQNSGPIKCLNVGTVRVESPPPDTTAPEPNEDDSGTDEEEHEEHSDEM